MRETFSKEERLCRQTLIQQLFASGSSLSIPPLKARWLHLTLPTTFPVQLLIAVPKASFHDASGRNLVRRRIRESYRRHKTILYESLSRSEKQMALAVTFSGREILPYSTIEEKIILLLQRLKEENEKAVG